MPTNPEYTKQFIEGWHQLLKEDLNWRLNNLDERWSLAHQMCRNSRSGARRGNVVSDFVTSLVSRFLAKAWDIKVQPHSPTHSEHAKDFETVATVLSETTNLLTRTQRAALNATWGSGWAYVGHPLDQYCLFPDKRISAPDPTGAAGFATPDEWVPVEQEELEAYGINPSEEMEEVPPFLVEALEQPKSQDPQPILPTDYGMPWVKVIDPRYVIHNMNASDVEDCEYIAVLHFLTRKELAGIFTNLPEYLPLDGTMRTLWAEVEGKNAALYPELTCIVEVYLRNAKNDPDYSWHRFAYPYGAPESYLFFVPNNHGKFIPLIPLKLNMVSMLWDTTIAMQLMETANRHDVVHQALDISIEREMHQKWLVNQTAGLSTTEEKKLRRPDYEGTIKVNDLTGIKEVEGQFNTDLLRAAMYYKTMAQATTGQSDLDRGQAIKGITARQTDVLVQSSGTNIEAMGSQIAQFVSTTVFKLIYLLTRYGPVGRAAELNYGRLAVIFERGTQDVTTSLLYKVYIRDTGRDPTVDEQLSFNQAIRTLSQGFGQVIAGLLDPEFFAREFLAVYGKGPEGLRRAPAMPGGQGMPGLSPPGIEGSGQVSPTMVEMLQGQHTEREPGDRGVSQANMKSGLRMTGMGSGEQ